MMDEAGVVEIKLSEEEWKLLDELLVIRLTSSLYNLVLSGFGMLVNADGLKDYRRCMSWFNNMEAYVSNPSERFPSYDLIDKGIICSECWQEECRCEKEEKVE